MIYRVGVKRRIGLGVVLATTMAASTFAPVIFAVLATDLRNEFSADRWQIGALVTVVTAVGALLSPYWGTVSDRMVPRYSTSLTLSTAAAGFLALGVAPSYLWLAAASVLAGAAQALGNPSTNRLIMTQAEAGRRGVLTGIKQAGVQAGNFLGGILLPVGAASVLGWRGTVAAAAFVPVSGLALLGLLIRGRPTPERPHPPQRERASAVVMRLAVYGGLIGIASGSLLTYLPSYSQETFGFSTEAGGALVSLFAAVGFVTRLTAGPLSERRFGHHRTLAGMAAFTAFSGALLAVAPSGGWLWPVAALIGLGPMAWNVVGNLAVMELSPEGAAGRGSGVMMAGFLGGMAVGAPLFGGSVDLIGSYRPGWVAVGLVGAVAAWVARRVKAEEPVG
ncbi:MAG TPA: MFS transporter [Acidimicrobiia bacterium]|nr:MFS transporter [Acidimicrobiia bacterium]